VRLEPAKEVWLRGNVRPAALLVAAAAATGTSLVVLAALPQTAAVGLPLAVGFALLAGPFAAGLGLAAARPRLARHGDVLRVRLAPLAAYDVPLEFVECFFMGSHVLPDPQGRDDVPTQRVGTLVMRIAERATAWQARQTFAPWGSWADGAVVFDGRWCEPLSGDLARRLSTRLVEAKRAVAERTA
jgi:hypothetical protein